MVVRPSRLPIHKFWWEIFILLSLGLGAVGTLYGQIPEPTPEGVVLVPWQSVDEPSWVTYSHGWRLCGRTSTDVYFLAQEAHVAGTILQSTTFKEMVGVIVLLVVLFLGRENVSQKPV